MIMKRRLVYIATSEFIQKQISNPEA